MGVGAGLIIWAIFRRMKEKKNKLGILLFPMFLSSVIGCSTALNEAVIDDGKIIVKPSTLDFGHARPTDSPVVLHFEIINKSPKNIVISDIVSGCGCTVVEVPKDPIMPGKTASASVKVNLFGRMGNFTNTVVIKTQNHGIMSLDIRGVIEADIWCNGQAIRCTASQGQKRVPTMMALYTLKYPDIEFDWSKLYDNVSAKIVSRERRENGETMIQLAVDVAIGDNAMMSSSLNLVPTDKSIAPLMIPVYCSREEEPQSVPHLLTSQISLGSLKNNESVEFSVFGDPDILQVVRSVELRNTSTSFSIQLLESGGDSQPNEIKINLKTQDVPAGFIEGMLILKTAGEREYFVPFLCEIRQ